MLHKLFCATSSSSISTRAHCGLWPVEQCSSIFSYLPPTLSIFSLPALEDLFLLPLSIFSWVFPFFFFFFHWHYSPLWALACRTMSFHFFLSATNSLHLLTPSTWRSLSLPLSFFSWVFPFFSSLPVLEWRSFWASYPPSSILSGWPNQLILCPFIHFTIFSPLLISSSFVRLFNSPFSYLEPYILLNIFLSEIRFVLVSKLIWPIAKFCMKIRLCKYLVS